MAVDPLLKSLVSLFDDCDSTVCACVEKKLTEMGRQVTDRLAEMAEEETDKTLKELILAKRASINAKFRMDDLVSLSRSAGTAGFSLYETVLVISSLLDADFSRRDFQRRIVECSARISSEISPGLTAPENVEIFNYIFFNVLGFKVLDTECKEWEYALMPQVLSTGRGNPFTVSMIYFIVAAEAGMPVLPLCVRGGFIPAYVENGKELFYMDISNGGKPFNEMALHRHSGAGGGEMRLRSTAALPGIWLESLLEVCRKSGQTALQGVIERALDVWTGERYLCCEENDV